MVDNVKVCDNSDPGAPLVATEDIGGVHYPVYKVAHGPNGTATLVDDITPLPATLFGAEGKQIAVDPYSGSLNVIDHEHARIHAGDGFSVSMPVSVPNVGGTLELLGVCPAFCFPHFRRFQLIMDSGPFEIELFEGATYSDPGTLITPTNNNRNSGHVPTMLVYQAPTLTADGDRIDYTYASGTKQSGALGAQGLDEWILKQSQAYMIRITNNTSGAGTSTGGVNLFWYEYP